MRNRGRKREVERKGKKNREQGRENKEQGKLVVILCERNIETEGSIGREIQRQRDQLGNKFRNRERAKPRQIEFKKTKRQNMKREKHRQREKRERERNRQREILNVE